MRRRAYLYFVAIFIIGVIVGGVAVYTYAWNTGTWRRRWNEDKALHNMQRDLDLSPAQVASIKLIWDQTGKSIHELQAQTRPQIDALRQQVHDRIRKILNPDQVKKFDEMLEQRRKANPPPRR